MTQNYYISQGLPNFINNTNYIFPVKQSALNNNNVTNTSSNKTIENTDESYGIEEFHQKDADIDHLLKFHLEKTNNPFQINSNLGQTINANKIPHFSFVNPSHNLNALNRPISGKIPYPRKTSGFAPYNRNRLKIEYNKRSGSLEKKKPKKLQSKYSSATENKYHFMERFVGNQKFGMNLFSEINIPKASYVPLDNTRRVRNHSISKSPNNMDTNNLMSDSELKTDSNANTNSNDLNIVNGVYSNQSYVPIVDQRKNEFFNNQTTSNFSYDILNGNKLKDNIQMVGIDNGKNNQVNNLTNQNELMGYFQNNPKKINNTNTNTYNLNNNYSINNPIYSAQAINPFHTINPINLTHIINPINSTLTNNPMPPTYTNNPTQNINSINPVHTVNPINYTQTLNLEGQRLETVGYNNISSENYANLMPPQNKKNNLINFNQNLKKEKKEQIQLAVVTKVPNVDDNSIENTNNVNVANNENFYVNDDLDAIINQINDHTNKILAQQNNTKYLNDMKTYNNLISENSTSNTNILTQQEVNQLFGQSSNLFSKGKQNLYNPSIPITANNYETGNIYLNDTYTQPQNPNPKNKFIEYNQPESERVTVVNDKININGLEIEEQPSLSNNIDLIYNDFDGSGLMKNYNGMSLPGKDFSGKTKTNQDAFVCKTNINNIKDFNVLGVLDGHGPNGHFVSEFASEFIPSKIINHPEIKKLSDPESVYQKLKENNCDIITEAFLEADNQLKTMEFDISESGCTCCLIIHIGTHIICANTGDSRAIVVYDQTNDSNSKKLNSLQSVPLSIDYKPDLPEEMERIISAGGVVEQMKDNTGELAGPYRVWIKGKDYPGLAMSRSLGDMKGKSIGVIADPGILEYDLNKSTKYIIACSDGVWEFLNNEVVMNIGKRFYLQNNAVEYCHELVSRAFKEWQKNEKIVDDITVVVAFF